MAKPRRLPQRQTQQVTSVAPPTRGLDTTGDFATMQPTDAVEMDNLIPSDAGLTVRQGWREYAAKISTGDPVQSILIYSSAPASGLTPPLAASTIFAVTDKGIYNVEGGGDMTSRAPAIALSGANNAGMCTSVMFTAGGGKQYLIVCSEADGAFLYDGLTWKKFVGTGAPAPGVVTGVDPALFVQVVAWKYRLGFIKRGSAEVWWLPVNNVGGVAEGFDFGPILRNGGMLLAAINWTQDAGEGIDDRLVLVGSSGDLAVYQGTDPTDATQFSQVGIWYVGQPPVGRRFYTTSGGNIYLLTQFGVIPVAQLMEGGLDTVQLAGTDLLQQLRKIQTQLADDFQFLLNTPGWQLLDLPAQALLQIARPSTSASEHIQYVFQQHALAWSRVLDVPAFCFARRLNEVYAGTSDGRVLRVFWGFSDGQKISGTGDYEIRSKLTPAFNYFSNPGVRKRALMMRAQFLAKASPAYSVRINTDFELTPVGGTTVGRGNVGSLWDVALWDKALWSGGKKAYGEWRSVSGMGYALAPSLYISSTEATTLASIEYMTDSGGPL
jgi:hypothetical protein